MNISRLSSLLCLMVALGTTSTAWAQSSSFPAPTAKPERAPTIPKTLPLRFEPSDRTGTFVARGLGQPVRLTGRSIDFPLGSGSQRADSIRLEFVGARARRVV